MPKTFKCSLNLQRDRSRRADCQKIPRVFLVSAAMFSHLHVNKRQFFFFVGHNYLTMNSLCFS